MKALRIAARLKGVTPAVPQVVADYACDGPAMIGVMRIAAGSSDHHWERHGHGDEVLYLLAGRALFTTVGAKGTDQVLVEAGDLLVLERDEAHRGRALEDVTVLFVTPRNGNVVWSDKNMPEEYAHRMLDLERYFREDQARPIPRDFRQVTD